VTRRRAAVVLAAQRRCFASKASKVGAVRGTKDLIDHDAALQQQLVRRAGNVCERYGFAPVTTLFPPDTTTLTARCLFVFGVRLLPSDRHTTARARRGLCTNPGGGHRCGARHFLALRAALRCPEPRVLRRFGAGVEGDVQIGRPLGENPHASTRGDRRRVLAPPPPSEPQNVIAPAVKELLVFRHLTAVRVVPAGVVRAVIGQGLVRPGMAPLKLHYAGPMFRYERPQKGRLRQFHQIGVETLGEIGPDEDAEAVALGAHVLQELGLLEHTRVPPPPQTSPRTRLPLQSD